MSSEALAWAFKLNVKPSSLKFTLIALCECANYQTGRITPSVAHISQITGQDRKTVMANVAELERRNLIKDTGQKVGRTGQIKVFEVSIGAENEQSQKRDTIPKTAPLKGPVFPIKGSQKRDTEPSKEPSSSNEDTQRSAKKVNPFPKPAWADASIWSDFLKNRKVKRLPNTETAYRGFLADIERHSSRTWTPEKLLEHATMKGWGGIYAPSGNPSADNDSGGGMLGHLTAKKAQKRIGNDT